MKETSRESRQRWWMGLGAALGLAFAVSTAQAQGPCVGDCNDDGEVTIDELLIMVNIALGAAVPEACVNGDKNCDGEITVDEIIVAVSNALGDPANCVPIDCPTEGLCGDGIVQDGEECDLGGTCVGGNMSGTACTSDAQCGADQPGICSFGPAFGRTCNEPTDCPGGDCIRCKTFGGAGCAANCTLERDVPFTLVPGTGTSGGSFAVVFSELIPRLELPLTGSQVLTIGKERNGIITGIIKAETVQFPQIPVGTIACACVRGTQAKTCGGTLFDTEGNQSLDCSLQDNCAAMGQPPCTFVHGEGNSASGFVGCNGLEPINVSITQDCNAEPGSEPFPPEVELTGSGPAGSAILLNTIQIGTQVGACTPTFCTDADPPGSRGTPNTLPYTTGTATALVLNANDFEGFDIGPESLSGSLVSCANLSAATPVLTGAALAGAFTACDQPTIADIVVTNVLEAQ